MSASDSGQDIPPPPGMTPFLLVLLIALGLIGWGAYGQWQRDGEATRTLEAIRTLVPHVRTVVAERADGPVELTLPGETRPFLTAAIAARATGYIAERKIDIGSRVKAGTCSCGSPPPTSISNWFRRGPNSVSSRRRSSRRTRRWSRRRPT